MTDDLRALLRADLAAERPPPIGDLVGDAIRDGRRLRHRRRVAAAGTVAAGLVLVTAVLAGAGGTGRSAPAEQAAGRAAGPLRPGAAAGASGLPGAAAGQPGGGSWPVPSGPVTGRRSGPPPGSVPVGPTGPPATAQARTLTIHSGAGGAGRRQKEATPAGMVQLLSDLLPAGRTGEPAVAAGDQRHVRLLLDRGAGAGLLGLRVDRLDMGTPRPARGTSVDVTVRHFPDRCAAAVVADARWADGTVVRLDVATCREGRRELPTRPALTPDEAIRIVADPRWGVTMDADLVDRGTRRFGELPVFG